MKFSSPSAVVAWVAFVSLTVVACSQVQISPQPPAPAGLLDLMDRAAERALLAGLQAYDEAQYIEAEKQLQISLRSGLQAPRDRAAAHKTLAFIFCISQRIEACASAFRAARVADPQFALSRAEQGHPIWGPIYKQAVSN